MLRHFTHFCFVYYSFFSFVTDHKYTLVIGGTVTLSGLYAIKVWNQSRRLPPGPTAYPIYGASRVLNKGITTALLSLKEQYSDIACLSMGGNR